MVSIAAARAQLSATHSLTLTSALVGLFFVSGACGLVYQVLWVRILSLAFGITVFAVTVVLASFMAGLALGSLFGGRIAERLQRPLLAYGIVEIAVGLVALATPAAFAGVQWLYPLFSRPLGDDEALLFPIRVGLSFVLLVVPTALMGATLPIIVKSSLARASAGSEKDQAPLAGRIGLLYAANTFGAIVGTFVAGFWLIGGVGISRSIQLAAAANVIVGLIAIGLSAVNGLSAVGCRLSLSGAFRAFTDRQPLAYRRGQSTVTGRQRTAGSQTPHSQTADRRQPTADSLLTADGKAFPSLARKLALVVYGVSGMCSFAYEVVWTRMLALVLDTSIYAFVTMLSTVLVGIAIGSAAVTPFLRRRWNWPMAFAGLQILIAIAALWSIWAVASLADVRSWLETAPGLRRLTISSVNFNFVVAALAILPCTLVIGATFPIAARIYTVGLERSSERLGQIYSVNVFGAIFGAMLGGFVLLPFFGTQTSLLIISIASVGLAIALALGAEPPKFRVRLAAAGVGAGLFGLLWLAKPDLYQVLFEARFPDSRVVWFREGLETTVTIARDPTGVRTLYTNNRGQANDEPVLVNYHRQIAHLPLLVRPEASEILIIGLGSGGTAGAILQHPGTHVQVVELSEAVVAGAAQFSTINDDVLHHSNLSLKIGDGRNHLLTTQERYDLITNDTIQPYDAGSTNLYSAEFYRLAMNVLTHDGIVAQWIGPFDDYQYKMMIRTFLSVFPEVTLWLNGDLIIGSRQPINLDLPRIARRFESDSAREAMSKVGFEEPATVTLWFVATREELEAFVGRGPILTDDRPAIEYFRSLPGRGSANPPDVYSHFSRDADKVITVR